jgi:hypothetical protein
MRERWQKATGMIVESPDNPPDAVGPTFHADPDIHATSWRLSPRRGRAG